MFLYVRHVASGFNNRLRQRSDEKKILWSLMSGKLTKRLWTGKYERTQKQVRHSCSAPDFTFLSKLLFRLHLSFLSKKWHSVIFLILPSVSSQYPFLTSLWFLNSKHCHLVLSYELLPLHTFCGIHFYTRQHGRSSSWHRKEKNNHEKVNRCCVKWRTQRD